MRHLGLALLLTVTLGALLPARARGQAPRGALVILGGEPGGDSINTRFVRLARAAGPGPVVILPMANADPAKDVLARTRIFQSLGVATIALDLTRESAGSDSVARILGQASGIWFTGGSQNRLAAALLGTAALDSVRARYLAGVVVGGSSAGAMVMADSMFTGEERRPGGRRALTDSSTRQPFTTIDRDNVGIAPGFDLMRDAIIYPHFVRRQRHNRLISRVLERPDVVGVGIDETAAVVVLPGGEWEVIGESQVIVYDARASRAMGGEVLAATEIRMHVLGPGAIWSPRTGKLVRP